MKLAILMTGIVLTTGCVKRLSLPAAPQILSASMYSPANYAADVAHYNAALFSNSGQARDIRNAIVYSVMTEVDYAYGQYTTLLFTGKGSIGVAEDSTVLGMIAASTIAANPATKLILGVLTTSVMGVNLSADKNFFAQQSFQTLAVAMQTRRDKARESILLALTTDVSAYPLSAGMRDLTSYYYAGTLAGGLQEMQEEASTAAAAHAARGLH